MDDTLNRHIGRAVKMALWDGGITQQEMAAALDMEPSSMSRLLRGQRKWEISEVLAAADFLGVAVADLLPESARQNLVSVASGGADSVTRRRRMSGWLSGKGAIPDPSRGEHDRLARLAAAHAPPFAA